MIWLIALASAQSPGTVEETDRPQNERHRRVPDVPTSADLLSQLEARYRSVIEGKDDELEQLHADLAARQADPPEAPPLEAEDFGLSPLPSAQVGDVVAPSSSVGGVLAPQTSRQGPLVLAVPAQVGGQTGVLPAGSYALGTVLSGAEPGAGDELPMLIELDSAWNGPNHQRVDGAVGAGCRITSSVRARLATARAEGQGRQLSCVLPSGEAFGAPINAFLVGADNIFGLRGPVIRRDGAVVAGAFLSSMLDDLGSALARSQEVVQVVPGPLGTGTTATQVDPAGTAAYAVGRGVASASQTMTDMFLRRAAELEPVIGIGSGQPVWIVLLDSVPLPEGVGR